MLTWNFSSFVFGSVHCWQYTSTSETQSWTRQIWLLNSQKYIYSHYVSIKNCWQWNQSFLAKLGKYAQWTRWSTFCSPIFSSAIALLFSAISWYWQLKNYQFTHVINNVQRSRMIILYSRVQSYTFWNFIQSEKNSCWLNDFKYLHSCMYACECIYDKFTIQCLAICFTRNVYERYYVIHLPFVFTATNTASLKLGFGSWVLGLGWVWGWGGGETNPINVYMYNCTGYLLIWLC